MKCGKCGVENLDDGMIFCSNCSAPLVPFEKRLWDEIQGMYKASIDRFGQASMFTALLTGLVLVITGLADSIEFHPIPARDWVLIIGGILIPVGLEVRWLYVEYKNEKKKSGR